MEIILAAVFYIPLYTTQLGRDTMAQEALTGTAPSLRLSLGLGVEGDFLLSFGD